MSRISRISFGGTLSLLILLSANAWAGGNRLSISSSSGSASTPGSGSATVSSQTETTATAATTQKVQTSALAVRAQASLQQSLQALQAQQAAQSAARAAALNGASSVPNGLVLGGLVPQGGLTAPVSTTTTATGVTTTYALPTAQPWTGVGGLSQTTAPANSAVIDTVTQNKPQALLYWDSFNIGKNTTLAFDQSAGGANVAQWVAINKVTANIAPSQILGSLKADGQVYVINQNGIIFGGSSQVNVGALVASTLPINDNLVQRGLLNNPDDQFLFSQLNIASGSQGPTAAFTPASAPTSGTVAKTDAAGNVSLVSAAGSDGDVVVQAGAQLTSPTTSQNVGGKIALVGPNVTNAGTISTPDGQSILAAGNQVGFAAHNANDPTLRGLDIDVGAVDASSGTAVNAGVIDSPEADITLTGKSVHQNGVIDSSTSVALNGRIDLLADYGSVATIPSGQSTPVVLPTATGDVTLGPGSVTQILPELTSTATVVGTQLALSSIVDIQGQSVSLARNSLLWAPSAATPSDPTKPAFGVGGLTLNSGVSVNAGNWLSYNGSYSFFNTAGQIDLAAGATIDVSGSENVAASVAENIVTAQLRGTELANSPLQQNGPLRGQTVEVDLSQTGVNADGTTWIGTPLADLSGYVGLVQHSVGELTTNGGTVSLNAGQSVNLEAGSNVNVSGGWINYQGALVQTTKVVTDGLVLDISKATPNLVYDGIYTGYTATSAKWGVSQTFANALVNGPQYEAGYLQGGNGGSLSITAPTLAVNGNLYGNTVAGSRQRTLASQLSATYSSAKFLPTVLATQAVPLAATLTLSFEGQNPNVLGYPTYAPTPAKIDFGVSQAAGDVVLSTDLVNADGFGNLTINNDDGSIFVPAGVGLTTAAGGSIAFNGANIDIEGSLAAPGGKLSFTTDDYSPYADSNSPLTGDPLLSTPPSDSTRGNFTLGANASLSVAGLLVDDRSTAPAPGSLPLATSGGTIAIEAYSATLTAGSILNVSGGAAVSGAGKVTYGNGGSLSIVAGQDPNLLSLVGGHLVLGSTLEGYSGGTGGSLTIQAPLIQVGGQAADPANTLLLSPSFFNQGGFSSFSLNGLGEVNPTDPSLFLPAVSVAAGTTIDPLVQAWQATLNNSYITLSSTTYPLASQRSPVSLSFGTKGVPGFGGGLVVRGDVVMGVGAVIETDPKGRVTLTGNTVDVLGKIIAPGGTITISGKKNATNLFSSDLFDPLVTVDLGANSLLSTAGTVELTYNANGFTTGTVLPGGTINVSGNILAEKGAVLNVSGASGILDVASTQAGGENRAFSPSFVPVQVDSGGGAITLAGGQELVVAATLLGGAGGPSAQGGSLTVSSGYFDPSQGDVPTSPLQPTLDVTQSVLSYSSSGIGSTVTVNGTMAGLGYFAANSFAASGLDSLTLGGTVQFSGPVAIKAKSSLIVGDSGIIYADSAVNLSAPYVKLGQAFQGPLTLAQKQLPVFVDSTGNVIDAPAIYGTGVLTVHATDLIDVGNLSLQNIGSLNLMTVGDVRGDGALDVAGNIAITAGQIYPTTATTFTIGAFDYNGISGNGSVNINSSGVRQLPLSAGGTLNIYASNITQGGVLRAPIGAINLGSGVTGSAPLDPLSGLAYDSTQNLTLASNSITSVSAVDPVTKQDLTIPYGQILNGVSWIDPSGNDITVAGNGPNAVPSKAINISGANVIDQTGATIDISGGGDLYAYRFVSGTGGTNDILASTTSYAIIPGYAAGFAPYYSSSDYVNSSLAVGSQIYLSAGSGVPAGVYTLLPARYALLPGAFLVTPTSGAPPATAVLRPDGSSIVSGYRFNGLDATQTSAPLLTSFEVDSRAVVRSRAEYDNYSANTFLQQNAAAQGVSVRLPVDAGQLVLAASQSMTIQGAVSSQAANGGLGGEVDIASSSNILITGPQTDVSADLSASTGPTLLLDSSDLSAFGADSLLIGGYRTSTTAGTSVAVLTNDLTVDNSGAALKGPDVILASNQTLTLDAGADVQQSGSLSSPAETLLLGNTTVAGSGNGALVRVTSDASAQTIRAGVNGASDPDLIIGAGVKITGASLTLDSTATTLLDPTANLSGNAVAINSGQISLVLDGSQPGSGLVLSGAALAGLQSSAKALSLLSYSSIDIYENGTGAIGAAADASGKFQVQSLALHADDIRGFDGGTVAINAQNVILDNSTGAVPQVIGSTPSGGELVVNAGTIQLGGGSGTNVLNIDGYSTVNLNASKGVLIAATASAAKDSSGNPIEGSASLVTAGGLQITAPVVTGATEADLTIMANGALAIDSTSSSASSTLAGGLGATLNLVGTSVTENSLIQLSSGDLGIKATGAAGNIEVGGTLDVSGTAQTFNDLIKYTSGGQISLKSDLGSVILDSGSTVTVAANAGGGNAGGLTVSAANGSFQFAGAYLEGQAGAGGQSGTFSLDVSSLPAVSSLEAALESSGSVSSGFTQSQTIRVRNGDVAIDGVVRAGIFNLSADQGSITVTGTIDASNVAASDSTGKAILVGGSIDLDANGSVTLASGSVLTVAGQNFNNAGKGGSVTLAAGSETNGQFSTSAFVDIQGGSTIDLSVAGSGTSAADADAGEFSGTLHIRAPQLADGTDLQVDPIGGNIVGASNIVVEGYRIYIPSGGLIDSVEGSAATSTPHDGTVYGDAEGFADNSASILSRLLNGTANASQTSLFQITPGAEIINPNTDTPTNPTAGDLTLAGDWDLSTFRFGPNVDPAVPGSGTPGILTLRAGGNLIFEGSLSDGFSDPTYTATLLTQSATSPANGQSWSYNLVAGADLGAADFHQVVPSTEVYDPTTGLAVPGTATGSLELGNFVTQNNGNAISPDGTIDSAVEGYDQVIRTGTGDINIATSGDVLLQNQFATIYTAGVGVADPTLGGAFVTPTLEVGFNTFYPAQYSVAGGNVTIGAKGDIAHVTQDSNGVTVIDSEKELPNNWLYRRGYVDPTTGQFGASKNDSSASTSWWIDFSNYFEGVGTLGGGNVTLTAGHDVSNVDAVAPTNARVTSQTTINSVVDTQAADQTLVELGGGNVVVQAGNDINGGAYYVERGQGSLTAGNSIITNTTRSASLGTIAIPAKINNFQTWLPTTLFLGAGSFNVTAQNDLLLGPVANPFLLPQGTDNTYWDKTYFSTYAATDSVDVTSLAGTVTLRESATVPGSNAATPLLQNWLQSVDLLSRNPASVSSDEPWLQIAETSVIPFSTVVGLMPGTLQVTAFTGDVDIAGNLTLSPSSLGTVDLLAGGSINALQPNGNSGAIGSSINGVTTWSTSTLDLSDADPNAVPGVYSPYAYEVVVGTAPAAAQTTGGSIRVNGVQVPVKLDLSFINNLFAESGSTEGTHGVLQNKLKLHDSLNGGPLHADDPNPVHLYADNGDISGLTLFSGKAARVIAGQDITDIALYIQNDNTDDVSLVAAGRDIIAYDSNSPLRTAAQSAGNQLDIGSATLAGDIQISGPGTLEVLAGRDLNLGVGPNNADGTGVGISSIGNERNPVLPFAGADIVAAAGVGGSSGLDAGSLDFTNVSHTGFTDLFLDPATGGTEAARYLPDLGALMDLSSTDSSGDIWTAFEKLPADLQDKYALDVFYLVLRDAGRDHNDPTSAGSGNYTEGDAAIAALFPGNKWYGNISLTSREIKTTNGGDISLLAPGGQLDVGLNVAGVQPVDQGILTEDGGNISIFTNGDVNVGTSRIFTLRGGNEIIWSTDGDIAAGASSKTVQSAPPTRVLIDPQSGAVETDLAGLATGGGIGVLETVAGVPPADVDLIAPNGTVDAGDAGIRASGNLNIAAVQILNAGNIQVGGKSSGIPTVVAPNVAGLAAASNAAGATSNAADQAAKAARSQAMQQNTGDLPSIVSVEIMGYGGSEND
jgi:filamentous hemagglutinin